MTTTSQSKNKKAAGESGGRAPYAATLANVPDFMRLEANELLVLLNVLRDPLAVHLYLLLLTQMDYTGGEFMSSYARLMELMTPPVPERGRRRSGPSYKQVRTALDSLIACGLVNRGLKNAEQGQLRLHLASRARGEKPALTEAQRQALAILGRPKPKEEIEEERHRFMVAQFERENAKERAQHRELNFLRGSS